MLQHALALLLSLPAFAPFQGSLPPEVEAGLSAWRAKYGQNWRFVFDENTGKGRMLYGGGAFRFFPQSVAEGYALSRDFLDEAVDIFGVDPDTLVDDRTIVLPLAASGTTDKVAVRLRQELDGVPVEDATVCLVYELQSGFLLSIDCQAVPGVGTFEALPSVTATQAEDLAVATYESATGEGVADLSVPELVVLPVADGGTLAPALAWAVDVWSDETTGIGTAFLYYVAATGTPVVLDAVPRNHDYAPQQTGPGPSSTGRVLANVTEDGVCCEPGHCCWLTDQGANTDEVRLARMRVEVTSQPGLTLVTNANGEFSLPQGGTVRLAFEGPYVSVDNSVRRVQNPPDLVVDASVAGSLTLLPMNPSPSELDVAQANAFYRVNQMRAWVRSVNPYDATMDSSAALGSVPYRLVVNDVRRKSLSDPTLVPYCKTIVGQYQPFNQKILLSVGDPDDPNLPNDQVCSNAAMATVIWHEMGHWLNDRYGSGNKGNRVGFGEGMADAYSLYLMDYHQLAFDAIVRDGDNLAQHLGDCVGASGYTGYPPHHFGQPLMGAFWKLRKDLKLDLGEVAGGQLADRLFLGWLNAFDQHELHSIIARQLLVLDDDDRNLDDESPSWDSIEHAFALHGFAELEETITICDGTP